MRIHSVLYLLVILVAGACTPQNQSEMTDYPHTNRLAQESSPYLLQHAHNPVNWYPWGDEAFEKARAENKLVLVSIGYSSCHWCHVMERESFESDTVAKIMNEHFVCVKVDREERPDVDQIYMDAVQLMTGGGGWPLNCFTLPDGRPVYGGTYFPQDQWIKVLDALHDTWQKEPEKFKEYAERLTEGVRQSELVQVNTDESWFSKDTLDTTVMQWKNSFDNEMGGPNRAPKFPLPNNYEFLMHYAHQMADENILKHVRLTLDKMAGGGIYDQAGGGFARYSVDMIWKVPHFEKMLYDNGQLLSLYSKAYKLWPDSLYKRVVSQTAGWLEREMTNEQGGFYSALDADSEGEEGKFYVWQKAELETLFPEDFDFLTDLYSISERGHWEQGNYILMRNLSDEELKKKHNLSPHALEEKIAEINNRLLTERENRIRPGLDDKALTSWNAMTISGLCHAYGAFGDEHYLALAKKSMHFILKHQKRDNGGLNHTFKDGKSTINGYLEDYCFTIEALIDLYEATFDESWLREANGLTEYAIAHFSDEETGMFYFTSDLDPPLIARKTEVNDNVVPASNSSMAKALFKLGHLNFNEAYLERSKQMLRNVSPKIPKYGPGYSNWAQLMLFELYPFYEVVITGADVHQFGRELRSQYGPDRLLLGAAEESALPLFENRFFDGKTTIFVCVNKACQLPVHTVSEAMKQMK